MAALPFARGQVIPPAYTPAPSPSPSSAAPAPQAALLRQILITEGVEAAQALQPVSNDAFLVVAPSVSFIDAKELERRLAAGRNRPIDEPLLAAVAQVVEIMVRQKDFGAAQVVIPPQDISTGAVRVAVLPGRVRNIEVTGNRWFSESLFKQKLRLDQGEMIKVSELESAIARTNTNPFRRIHVNVQPIAQTGEVDLKVAVQERLPLLLQTTYENSGTPILGSHRYNAAVTYGNVWGLDHQATYQFITSNEASIFQGHAFDYRVALPWDHVVQLSGSLLRATPTGLFDGYVDQDARSISADLRYSAPWRKQRWQGDASAAFSFKQTNSNLFLLDEPVPLDTADVFTFTLGSSAARDDSRGRWIFSANLTGSPGNLNSRNTREAYHDSRILSNPRFLYGHAAVQRITRIIPKLVSTSRAVGQLASTNLVGSEQFSVGGFNTVRGYSDRVLSGDSGYTFSEELQYEGPAFALPKKLPRLNTAAVAFWDYARVIVKHPLGKELKSADIYGAGFGIRLSAGYNFSAAIDYGFPLVDMVGESSRAHVKISLAY